MELKPRADAESITSEIRIEQTDNEYLLYIPFDQKERAREIDGRRWDPERRCWVYPRNKRMYQALVSEFGVDLTESSVFTAPQLSHDKVSREKEEKQQGLRSNNERQVEILTAEVNRKESENKELKKRVAQLETEYRQLHINPTTQTTETTDRNQLIKDIAVEVTGNDPVFGEFMRNLEIDENLPLRIGGKIENHLRSILKSSNRSLYDLIMECRDADKLDEDDIGLAHGIRKQRNIVAHHGDTNEDDRTKMGRAYFCLFAASLLFPKLPED